MTQTDPLEDAYQAVRAHLHGPHRSDDGTRNSLRSLLWLVAEAVEQTPGHHAAGMPLRDLGDSLAGVTTSPRLRTLLERHADPDPTPANGADQ